MIKKVLAFLTGQKFSRSKDPAPLKYRADVDGLRGLAVLFVVGYHAFPDIFRSGFVGVDIFFVISGYLISSIILSNLEQNNFSLIDFYSRRVRRIFPALILVLLFCFAFGWFVLMTDEFKQLGKHIMGGAGFVSNFISWKESGYFDNAADTKPLLHLWSLAIEEQFYIFWPLLLVALWKWRKSGGFLRITASVAAVSFIVNIYLIRKGTEQIFYLPISRFWELMIGGILAYVTLYRPRAISQYHNARAVLGFVLLLLGLVFINRNVPYPGWFALLPTLGAFLIIGAGPQAWINRMCFSNRILVGIGLISYPLYLWHWPLLSYSRILFSGSSPKGLRFVLVVFSLMLAWLTYRFVEKPIRFGTYRVRKTIGLVGLMLFVGFLGLISYFSLGIPARNVVKVNVLFQSGFEGGAGIGVTMNDCRISDEKQAAIFAYCQRDARQTERFALMGDSKAASLFPGLVRTSSERGRWLFIGGNAGGKRTPGVMITSDAMNDPESATKIALEAIIQNPNIETVVLVGSSGSLLTRDHSIENLPARMNYAQVLDGLMNMSKRITRSGKKVVFVIDNPPLPNPKDCFNRITGLGVVDQLLTMGKDNPQCRMGLGDFNDMREQYIDLLSKVKKSDPEKIFIFDTTHIFCDLKTGICPASMNGHMLYGYTDHMSDYAASLVGKELNEFLLHH
ncbi:MAG: acyltransferase [Candidatus Omnitrophica bacterium]|nr:acyltransferase [Candidatus Omnitrophota bacterium]